MKDECGSLGPELTNPIITLQPNVLSTYVPPYYSIGSTYTDPNLNDQYFAGQAEPLTIADLQCPTFGLGIKTSSDGNLYTTVGPPWLPIIIPPPEVFTLDPTWESVCTDLASYYVFMSFAIFDPPFALAPESYLVSPPPAASSLKLKSPPQVPTNPTAAFDPQATNTPDLSDPPNPSIAPPLDKPPMPQEPPANTAQPAAVPLDPSAKPTTVPDPPSKFPSKSQEDDSTQPLSSGLGLFTFGALGKGDHQASGSAGDLTHIIPVPVSGIEEVTVGRQVLSIGPSGLYLSRTSYSPGGPAITLSDGVISLVSTSPAKEAATPDGVPPTNNQPFTPSVQTIAGQDVVSNTSGVYIAGLSLSPGASAITSLGTVTSLSPAGTLIVGSSSIAIPLANIQETSPAHFTLNGVPVQAAEPSAAVVVGGITLTPGAPGTVVHGKSISLQQSGTLNIGTDHFALAAMIQEQTPSALMNSDGLTIQSLQSSAVLSDRITTLTPGGAGHFFPIDENGVSPEREESKTLTIAPSHLPPLPSAAAAQNTPPPTIVFDLNNSTGPPHHSTLTINGISLTSGEPGTTTIGSSVSLDSGGILNMGTTRFAIPSMPVIVNGTSVVSEQTFESAQGKVFQRMRLSCLLVVVMVVVGVCGGELK